MGILSQIPQLAAVGCFAATGGLLYLATDLGFDHEGPLYLVEPEGMPKAMGAPVLATFGVFCLYYTYLFQQSAGAMSGLKRAKADAKKNDQPKPSLGSVKYGKLQARYNLKWTRTAGNYMEQLPPLLTTLWIHAYLVSAAEAGLLGWVWVASRVIYPVVFSVGFPMILLSTGVGYTVIGYFILRSISVVTGIDIPIPSPLPLLS